MYKDLNATLVEDGPDAARQQFDNTMSSDEYLKLSQAADTAPLHSIEQFAQMFVAEHGDKVRYCHLWDTWMIWDGARWSKDTKMKTFNLARKLCKREARKANDGRLQRSIASPATWEGVLKAVRPDVATEPDEWDRDLYLLNTPDGTIDLRTGEMKPHDPNDYITKITAVSPKAGDCPIWKGHLHKVLGGNGEMIAYHHRLGGYCLTGDVTEKQFCFAYGTGDNGKSKVFNTWLFIMGNYAQTAAIETFTATKSEQHPAGLAALCGARLVLVSETESGKMLRESAIKVLTGGDKMTARFMRCNPFDYLPQLKLIMFGNYKPILRSVNQAMRTRIHFLPYTITIPRAEQDKGFQEKLAAEYPQILHWMIEGAKIWFKDGLNPPQIILDATDKYLLEQDKFAMFIEDCLDVSNPNAFTSTSSIIQCQHAWAKSQNEWEMREADLVEAMEAKGYQYKRQRLNGVQMRGFKGVSLQIPVVVQEPSYVADPELERRFVFN